MKRFYVAFPLPQIFQTLSEKSSSPIFQTPSGESPEAIRSTPASIFQTPPGKSLPFALSDLEDALIRHLETFLLELGGDLAFIGRQRRLRIGGQWYRVDLLFFHRALRCLLVIDLKIEPLTHADAGQMHLYLNYAREHWTRPGENPPVGLILCAKKGEAVAHYAIEGLANKILAAEYRTTLPDEEAIAAELERTRDLIEKRASSGRRSSRRRRGDASRDGED
jgi:hypothetical protein